MMPPKQGCEARGSTRSSGRGSQANRGTRRAVGTAVFGGMLFASLLGIFFVPMLYVVFQWLRERVSRRPVEMPVEHQRAPME